MKSNYLREKIWENMITSVNDIIERYEQNKQISYYFLTKLGSTQDEFGRNNSLLVTRGLKRKLIQSLSTFSQIIIVIGSEDMNSILGVGSVDDDFLQKSSSKHEETDGNLIAVFFKWILYKTTNMNDFPKTCRDSLKHANESSHIIYHSVAITILTKLAFHNSKKAKLNWVDDIYVVNPALALFPIDLTKLVSFFNAQLFYRRTRDIVSCIQKVFFQ